MMPPTVDRIKIDELSQAILWLLRDADAQRSTSQLVNEMEVDDINRIRYRINKLQDAGLIDHVATINKQPESQQPTKFYTINKEGLEWLYEH